MRRALQGAVVAALASLCLAVGAEPFLHTDDGCVVETHCIACLWQQGAVVEAPVGFVLVSAPAVVIGPVLRSETPPTTDGVSRTAPSRGPPAA